MVKCQWITITITSNLPTLQAHYKKALTRLCCLHRKVQPDKATLPWKITRGKLGIWTKSCWVLKLPSGTSCVAHNIATRCCFYSGYGSTPSLETKKKKKQTQKQTNKKLPSRITCVNSAHISLAKASYMAASLRKARKNNLPPERPTEYLGITIQSLKIGSIWSSHCGSVG